MSTSNMVIYCGYFAASGTVYLSDYGISTADYSKYSVNSLTVAALNYGRIISNGHAATQNSPFTQLDISKSYDAKSGVYTFYMTARCGNIDGNNSYSKIVPCVAYLTPQ